jgi:hypothetical protein
VFLHRDTAFSWMCAKQTLIAMSTNHSQFITLYETSRDCDWLRRVTDHIQISCCIGAIESPTIIYKDNAACVADMQTGHIKNNYMKHISLKLFCMHEL